MTDILNILLQYVHLNLSFKLRLEERILLNCEQGLLSIFKLVAIMREVTVDRISFAIVYLAISSPDPFNN